MSTPPSTPPSTSPAATLVPPPTAPPGPVTRIPAPSAPVRAGDPGTSASKPPDDLEDASDTSAQTTNSRSPGTRRSRGPGLWGALAVYWKGRYAWRVKLAEIDKVKAAAKNTKTPSGKVTTAFRSGGLSAPGKNSGGSTKAPSPGRPKSHSGGSGKVSTYSPSSPSGPKPDKKSLGPSSKTSGGTSPRNPVPSSPSSPGPHGNSLQKGIAGDPKTHPSHPPKPRGDASTPGPPSGPKKDREAVKQPEASVKPGEAKVKPGEAGTKPGEARVKQPAPAPVTPTKPSKTPSAKKTKTAAGLKKAPSSTEATTNPASPQGPGTKPTVKQTEAAPPKPNLKTAPHRIKGYEAGRKAGDIAAKARAYRDGVQDGLREEDANYRREKETMDQALKNASPDPAKFKITPRGSATVHIDDETFSLNSGEVRKFTTLQTALRAKSNFLTIGVEKARSVVTSCEHAKKHVTTLLEDAQALDADERVITALHRLVEGAETLLTKARNQLKAGEEAVDVATEVRSRIQARYEGLQKAVVDSGRGAPAQMKYYADMADSFERTTP